MNIWAWVHEAELTLREQGHVRLADLIDRLPELVLDRRHQEVDAMVPEALALAKGTDLPWLEVFIRHWELQSLVLGRSRGEPALPKAVDLVELTSRPGFAECPQAVCAVQDLANCYGHTDGPGFVEERLQVARETLARISPKWPCFTCISCEYASALDDGERYEEALAFSIEQIAELKKSGDDDVFQLQMSRVDALLYLRRFEEAVTILETLQSENLHSVFEIDLHTKLAHALGGVGRGEEGRALLPSAEDVAPSPSDFAHWCRAAMELAHSGGLDNDASLGHSMARMYRELDDAGAKWDAAVVRRIAADLAIGRGAFAFAELQLEDARALHGLLRKAEREQRLVASLQSRLTEERTPVVLPETAEETLQGLSDVVEQALDVLSAASVTWPQHEGVTCAHAAALRSLGFVDRAERRLVAQVASDGPFSEAFYELARTRLYAQLFEAFDALFEGLEDLPPRALWFRAKGFEQRGDLDGAAAAITALLALDDADVPRVELANIERRRERFEAAFEHLTVVTERNDAGPADWDLMVVATMLERWSAVRRAAARLGFEIDGEGPIDVDAGFIKLRIVDRGRRDFLAQRRGPVTARVWEMGSPGEVSRFGEVWLFDADDLGDGGEDELPMFRALHRIAAVPHSVHELDGVHPGDDALDELTAALRVMEVELRVRSGDGYMLTLPDTEDVVGGVFATMAVPDAVVPKDLHDLLQHITSDFAHPLTWQSLARAAGDDAAVAQHRDIAERYGL